MIKPSQNFWAFSVDLYAQDQVADACLELQNGFGIDVNLLLFCYWHGVYLGNISALTLARAIAFSTTWRQEVVQPLRNVRKWLKRESTNSINSVAQDIESFRQSIKANELAAENHQQNVLQQLALAQEPARLQSMQSGSIAACGTNIEQLLAAMTLDTNTAMADALALITQALMRRIDQTN